MTRTERTYYLVFGLYSVSWSLLGPMYALFLLSRGLDLFEINVVLATYLITAFVFEVPTGAIADLAGRKLSFLLSCVVRMGAFWLYAYAHDFRDCVIAEFIDAVGSTLASGALDAWAIDGMRAEGVRRPADRFFARAQMISRTLMIVSGLVSGYVAEIDLKLPWLIAAGGFALTAVVAAGLMEDRHPSSIEPVRWLDMHRSVGRNVWAGLEVVARTPVLLVLCLLTLATAFAVMPVHMFWQPRLQALTGQGTWLMGWVWALLNVASVTGSALIPRMLGQFSRARVLAAAAVWRGAMLALAGAATGASPAITGLLLQEMGFGVSEPMLQAWMNDHIGAERRATVLSVRAMCFTLGGGTGLVCLGLIARGFGIPPAWLISASIVVLTAPGLLLLGRMAQQVPLPLPAEPVPARLAPPALS
jgi:MFS family permease